MSEIRRQARARREEIGLDLHTVAPAESVVQACLAATGLTLWLVSPEDSGLSGAQAALEWPSQALYQDEMRPVASRRFEAAHMLAHFWLHRGSCRCEAADLNPAKTREAATGAMSKVEGSPAKQRRENEANLFAAELLLPLPGARRLFLEEGLSSEDIAAKMGIPNTIVQRQLADAVLLPPASDNASEEETPAAAAVALDASQSAAAHVERGPLLLGAGPGTGKTKTLVGRCRFLTQTQGVPAEKILALTFSRKAAHEMRERLAAAGVGTKTAKPWVGTFHSFGLEVLRRFGGRIGLDNEIKLLDTLDAVTLLENNLAELKLEVLDNLYNPATHLTGILGQIGRAKDELCPPERYAVLCEEMQARAEADAAALAARTDRVLKREQEEVAKGLTQTAKAREVAHCYGVYQRLMRAGGYLDYGDLIARTVEMLEEHPDVVATLRAEYPHVLADEYQDVNRACAHLVKQLAGDAAAGLWAVGDHRQSIYQFQGASPANVVAFGRDYPTGERRELDGNYRSRKPIVDLFGAASRAMEVPPAPNITGLGGLPVWHAYRGENDAATFPAVTYAIAPEEAGQADGMAQTIQDLHTEGWAYREQAILCRSHAQAEALAALLSARDIPVLYLGALPERPEIKDLLGLLSLLAEPDGTALVRVAALPEYAVPQADILAVLAQTRRENTPLLETLQQPDLQPGLKALGAHLAEMESRENDPAALLRHYLFGASRYLRHLAENESKPFVRVQQGMAIHQLLEMAGSVTQGIVRPETQAGPPNKVREFLAHLRRRMAAGEALRGTLPPEAEALDAVRLLTAHAAKGLEYPVVFLPNLGGGQFPTRGRSDGIPEPPGLADGEGLDEEQCLFFVALSRARDHLILSRAEKSATDRAIEPSPLLALIQPAFKAQGLSETAWPAGRSELPAPEEAAPTPTVLPEYSSAALETYGRCPRQYYYGRVLNLPGSFRGNGYPQFHACVRQTLHWLEDAREQGQTPGSDQIEAKLEALWGEYGPIGHLHEGKYKDSALERLRAAAAMGAETEQRASEKSLRATLSNCHVHVHPDAIRRDMADGTLIVARHLTGKPGANDHTEKRLALYRRAARQTHPETPVRVELRYLRDGTIRTIAAPEKKQEIKWEDDRIAKYEKAARGIQLGLFTATPESGDECQTCAFGLICPL